MVKEDKVHGIKEFKEKECVSVSCQTDIDHQQMDDLMKNVSTLKAENKRIRNELKISQQ